ncbi:MAG: hypothetical protein H0U55_10285 [Rubrobacteraceae bacterium]|nr:hypothetical protein [Rubrobacteraceae bacterium]
MLESEWRTFKDQLARQLRFIERSCGVYDEGYTDEAIQIAVRIRVILHPGGKKRRSLLQHLHSGRIPLLTTSEDAGERDDLIQYDGLGSLRASSDGEVVSGVYGPGEDDALYRDYIKADRWWQQVVLFAEGTQYSRRYVVLGVAEQEGGAHVAAEPTPDFKRLMTPGLLWDQVVVSNGVETSTPLRDIRFKYIRQMAYELLNSPELLKLAGYSPTRLAKHGAQPADGEDGPHPAGGSGEEGPQDEPEQELPEPEPQRPRPEGVKLTRDDLERIRKEVIRYFRAYYAEFREEIERRDPDLHLNYLRGRRHIVFELGTDGTIITHVPTEEDDDDFEFVLPKDKTVRELAEEKALKTPHGVTKRIHFDYDLGEDFGQNTYLGPLVHKEEDLHYRTLYYRTNWVQLDWASWVHLDRWRDATRAKEDVRLDLDFRLRSLY